MSDPYLLDARTAWRNYYRAVRVLRSLRQHNEAEDRRRRHAWWRIALREEYYDGGDRPFDHGRFTIAERLSLFKNGVFPMSHGPRRGRLP